MSSGCCRRKAFDLDLDAMQPCTLGIFVGGKSSRMGGRPKGLLSHPRNPSMTLVEHWVKLASDVNIECTLVGQVDAYGGLGLPTLADSPAEVGPMGGLCAFLEYCSAQDTLAVAVACDMPFVSRELLQRLCSAQSEGSIIAPRQPDTQRWEPLFARYVPTRVIPLVRDRLARRELSLQALIDAADGETLPVTSQEWPMLRDWDEARDILETHA